MSELIELNPHLKREPFLVLLSDYMPINGSLADKIQCLTDFCTYIEEVEDWAEQENTLNHWLAIASGFGAAATVACSGTFAPLVGYLLSGTSVMGAISTILGGLLTKQSVSPFVDKLTRYRLALESQEVRHWAIIWDMYGIDTFNSAVSYASKGYLSNGKLIQRGSDSPFERAINYLAGTKCKTYDEVINDINQITLASRQGATMSPSTQRTQPLLENPSEVAPVNVEQVAPLPAVNLPVPSPTAYIHHKQKIPNIPLKLAEDMKNTFIVGVPGAGKGILLSNAFEEIRKRGDTTSFYLDPKNSVKEQGYVDGRVDYVFKLEGGIRKASGLEVFKWLEASLEFYDDFVDNKSRDGRSLLVIDELTSLMKKLSGVTAKQTGSLKGNLWLEEKINVYVASGDAAGVTFWGIAQNGHNSSLGMDGGAKSQLTPIAIISDKQLSASQALLAAQFVPNDKSLSSEEIKEICSKSPIGRAIFHGGYNEWFPMPELPNYSGYNRDERQVIQTNTSSSAAPQTETERMLVTLEAAPMHTLWEFCEDILEIIDPEETKALMVVLAELLLKEGNEDLAKKFRIRSVYDVRYSYAGYRKKVAETHALTGGICAVCGKVESTQAHHIEYWGKEDKAGENLIPSCDDCHKNVCHSQENWNRASNLWQYRNTPEFSSQLRANTVVLASH